MEDNVTFSLAAVNTLLQCPLCLGYLRRAYTLTGCMHTFCGICLKRAWFDGTGGRCPLSGCEHTWSGRSWKVQALPDTTKNNIVKLILRAANYEAEHPGIDLEDDDPGGSDEEPEVKPSAASRLIAVRAALAPRSDAAGDVATAVRTAAAAPKPAVGRVAAVAAPTLRSDADGGASELPQQLDNATAANAKAKAAAKAARKAEAAAARAAVAPAAAAAAAAERRAVAALSVPSASASIVSPESVVAAPAPALRATGAAPLAPAPPPRPPNPARECAVDALERAIEGIAKFLDLSEDDNDLPPVTSQEPASVLMDYFRSHFMELCHARGVDHEAAVDFPLRSTRGHKSSCTVASDDAQARVWREVTTDERESLRAAVQHVRRLQSRQAAAAGSGRGGRRLGAARAVQPMPLPSAVAVEAAAPTSQATLPAARAPAAVSQTPAPAAPPAPAAASMPAPAAAKAAVRSGGAGGGAGTGAPQAVPEVRPQASVAGSKRSYQDAFALEPAATAAAALAIPPRSPVAASAPAPATAALAMDAATAPAPDPNPQPFPGHSAEPVGFGVMPLPYPFLHHGLQTPAGTKILTSSFLKPKTDSSAKDVRLRMYLRTLRRKFAENCAQAATSHDLDFFVLRPGVREPTVPADLLPITPEVESWEMARVGALYARPAAVAGLRLLEVYFALRAHEPISIDDGELSVYALPSKPAAAGRAADQVG